MYAKLIDYVDIQHSCILNEYYYYYVLLIAIIIFLNIKRSEDFVQIWRLYNSQYIITLVYCFMNEYIWNKNDWMVY